jgi:hypothetical protein
MRVSNPTLQTKNNISDVSFMATPKTPKEIASKITEQFNLMGYKDIITTQLLPKILDVPYSEINQVGSFFDMAKSKLIASGVQKFSDDDSMPAKEMTLTNRQIDFLEKLNFGTLIEFAQEHLQDLKHYVKEKTQGGMLLTDKETGEMKDMYGNIEHTIDQDALELLGDASNSDLIDIAKQLFLLVREQTNLRAVYYAKELKKSDKYNILAKIDERNAQEDKESASDAYSKIIRDEDALFTQSGRGIVSSKDDAENLNNIKFNDLLSKRIKILEYDLLENTSKIDKDRDQRTSLQLPALRALQQVTDINKIYNPNPS